MLYRKKNTTQHKQRATADNHSQLMRLTNENQALNSRVISLEKKLKQISVTKDKYKNKYNKIRALYTRNLQGSELPSHINSQFLTKPIEDNPYHLAIPQNQQKKKLKLTQSIENAKENLSHFMNIIDEFSQKIALLTQKFQINGKLDFINKKISEVLDVFKINQVKRGRSDSSSSRLSSKMDKKSRQENSTSKDTKNLRRRNRAFTEIDNRWQKTQDIGQELQRAQQKSEYFEDSEQYQND